MNLRSAIYWKLAYLIGASTALIVSHSPIVFAIFAVTQTALFAAYPVPAKKLRKTLGRLAILVTTVFVSNLFGQSDGPYWTLPLPWSDAGTDISKAGLQLSLELSLRVILVVLASVWVQQSSRKRDFVAALAAFRLPESVALTIDATLELATVGGGGGGGGGKGKHRRRKNSDTNLAESTLTWANVKNRKLNVLTDILTQTREKTAAYLHATYPHLDDERLRQIVLIAGGSVAIMSLRLLQVLPGLPIAPGHKNLVIVPVMLVVSKRYGRFGGGTALGVSVGLCSFMLGFGKFGLFEALHFIAPGVLADVLTPLLRDRAGWLQTTQLAFFGALMGAARFAANAVLIVLAGTPIAALVVYAPMLASQIAFGAAGSVVGAVLLAADRPKAESEKNGSAHD